MTDEASRSTVAAPDAFTAAPDPSGRQARHITPAALFDHIAEPTKENS